MNYTNTYLTSFGIHIQSASFSLAEGTEEWHLMLHAESRGQHFDEQYERLTQALDQYRQQHLPGAALILRRFFLSDSANQRPTVGMGAASLIQQPPLDGSKVALWAYLQRSDEQQITRQEGLTRIQRGDYTHLWHTGFFSSVGNSEQQTHEILTQYIRALHEAQCTMEANCVRTWFFCRDVDTQYAGLVKGRREFFAQEGMTSDTHYISSTGIGGIPTDPRAIVQMDAYAMHGLQPQQQQYLCAPTHLNRTIDYGVTFERGTLVRYGDRNQLYISGTASIDAQGNVLHVGQIQQQTQRMWENVEALLREGGSAFDDVMMMIVYLRDTADYQTVCRMFQERFPQVPHIITLAPVCRPTWLIEMECIAVQKAENPQYGRF